MAALSFTSPEGLVLGNPRHLWRVGRQLGSGACGSVHELSNTLGDRYAIKLARNPPPGSSRSKKKDKELRRNANLLHYEHIIYTAHVPHLGGDMIPSLPPHSSGFASYGDLEGWFCGTAHAAT